MRYITWGIVNFDAILLIMVFVSAFFMFIGKMIAAARIQYFVALAFLFIVVSPLARQYVTRLENAYPQVIEVPADVKGVLIVGGMVDRPITMSRKQAAFNFNGPRMTHIVRLMQRYPDLHYYIMAGGHPHIDNYQEGDILRRHFEYTTKNIKNIEFDVSASTTTESAKNSYEKLSPGKDRWLLVTSAYHMPRAMRDFQQAGWNVIAYPTDYKTKKSESYSFNFSIFKGILYWKIAMHEFLMHVIDGLDTKK